MPSVFTHSLVGLTAAKVITEKKRPTRFWIWSALCPIIPDLDVVCFYFVGYAHFFGHRGFFHSFLFAFIIGFAVAAVFFRKGKKLTTFLLYWLYFFLLTASNPILDGMTNGGLGVAYFAPFDNTRYFMPWRPIHVSPIGIKTFLTEHGLLAIITEMAWIWFPLLMILLIATLIKKIKKSIKH